MATHYFYRISPATTLLKVTDEFGPINTWEAVENPEKLVVTSGIVETTPQGQTLHSGPPTNTPIVTLSGAGWNSAPGATGAGTCHLCQQTTGPQTWRLERTE